MAGDSKKVRPLLCTPGQLSGSGEVDVAHGRCTKAPSAMADKAPTSAEAAISTGVEGLPRAPLTRLRADFGRAAGAIF